MLRKRGKSKKGWLRIVEAVIAALLVMSVLLVLVSKQYSMVNEKEKVEDLERSILDQVIEDPNIRTEVLSGDLVTVEAMIQSSLPSGYSFVVKSCKLGEICSLGLYVEEEVYVQLNKILENFGEI